MERTPWGQSCFDKGSISSDGLDEHQFGTMQADHDFVDHLLGRRYLRIRSNSVEDVPIALLRRRTIVPRPPSHR